MKDDSHNSAQPGDDQTDREPPLPALTAIADLPVLLVGPKSAIHGQPGRRGEKITLMAAAELASRGVFLTLNGTLLSARLKIPLSPIFDVLELYAFVRPAGNLVPTAGALSKALDLDSGIDDAPEIIRTAARALLAEVGAKAYRHGKGAAATAEYMADAGWAWGPYLRRAQKEDRFDRLEPFSSLPEWQEGPPPEPPAASEVLAGDAIRRLGELTGSGAEDRPAQQDYAATCCSIFAARENASAPNVAFLEAGTGIGKTLGYIAPASLWAEASGGTVWLSTYTKNLQRQLDQELSRLYPDPIVKSANAVTRKGRENYLCLLNLEEALNLARAPARDPRDRILLGLALRWVRASRDGDMIGGDFPAWLGGGMRRGLLSGLTDRRGECSYAACSHYRRCFIEKSKRAARHARLVVANHALVLSEAVNRAGDPTAPTRLVFDEGHHLFDAADSAFAIHLSGSEMSELHRWLVGTTTPSRSAASSAGRARGLKARIGDLVADDDGASALLAEVLSRATVLTSAGWLKRLRTSQMLGEGTGGAEEFLSRIHLHVMANAKGVDGRHSLECVPVGLEPAVLVAAENLRLSLDDLHRPIILLAARLRARLDDPEASHDSAARIRLEAAARGLERRGALIVGGWIPLLSELERPVASESGSPYVDWFTVERVDGREVDVGCYRHWLDPTLPMAEILSETAHGVAVTSATLSDTSQAGETESWQAADLRLGAQHFVQPPQRARFPSPFAYGDLTRVVVVTDVDKNRPDLVADAYHRLFEASGGGALGIFTAIERLRNIYGRIVGPLEDNGLPLLAQHVDAMDTGTLVDIFRAEMNSCLLGTDAVRDGIDVPGPSLRLIVFDRVPWPRPTILHRARRSHFGGRGYDEMVTRLKLKQAYGRLVRRASDKGVFVLLDAATPSRILAALPESVVHERMELAGAVDLTRDFLAEQVAEVANH